MKKKKYLIIAAHPDDETLGCGATIYNLRKEKKNVRVIFLGEGSTCRFKSDTKKKILDKVIEQRKKYSINALKILKAETQVCNETKHTLDAVKELIGSNGVNDDVFYDKLKKIENYLRDN